MSTPHEQQTQKRRGTGLTLHNADKASPGYTLFTTLSGDGTVYLIDLKGTIVHQWNIPYSPYYAELLPNGNLYFNGWTPAEPGDLRFGHWPLYKAGVALEAAWDGSIVWELKHPDHHHDSRRAKNGNILLLAIEPTPARVAKKIRGDVAKEGVWNDKILELTPKGEVVWEWHAWEHFDQLKNFPVHASEDAHHWPHANSLVELADGNLLVSFRGISHVVIIDRKTGRLDLGSRTRRRLALSALSQRTGQRQHPRVRQRHSAAERPAHVLARHRGRPRHENHRLGISRHPGIQLLQRVHLGRPAATPNGNTLITEGPQRPSVRGHARPRSRVGST